MFFKNQIKADKRISGKRTTLFLATEADKRIGLHRLAKQMSRKRTIFYYNRAHL